MKTKRKDFQNNLSLSLDIFENKICQNNDVSISQKTQQKGEVVFNTIRKHFKHEGHTIKILVEKFLEQFNKTYKPI